MANSRLDYFVHNDHLRVSKNLKKFLVTEDFKSKFEKKS
jgi:hypothetical protein